MRIGTSPSLSVLLVFALMVCMGRPVAAFHSVVSIQTTRAAKPTAKATTTAFTRGMISPQPPHHCRSWSSRILPRAIPNDEILSGPGIWLPVVGALVLFVLAQSFINQMLEGDQGLAAYLRDGQGYNKSAFQPSTTKRKKKKKSTNRQSSSSSSQWDYSATDNSRRSSSYFSDSIDDAVSNDPLPWLKLPSFDFVEVAGQDTTDPVAKELEELRREIQQEVQDSGNSERAQMLERELKDLMEQEGFEYNIDSSTDSSGWFGGSDSGNSSDSSTDSGGSSYNNSDSGGWLSSSESGGSSDSSTDSGGSSYSSTDTSGWFGGSDSGGSSYSSSGSRESSYSSTDTSGWFGGSDSGGSSYSSSGSGGSSYSSSDSGNSSHSSSDSGGSSYSSSDSGGSSYSSSDSGGSSYSSSDSGSDYGSSDSGGDSGDSFD